MTLAFCIQMQRRDRWIKMCEEVSSFSFGMHFNVKKWCIVTAAVGERGMRYCWWIGDSIDLLTVSRGSSKMRRWLGNFSIIELMVGDLFQHYACLWWLERGCGSRLIANLNGLVRFVPAFNFRTQLYLRKVY